VCNVAYSILSTGGTSVLIFASLVLFPTRQDLWNTWNMMVGSKIFIQKFDSENLLGIINLEDKGKECVIILKCVLRK
jgi:hypothetical protein